MRATDLKFRSPKEKTPDFELPLINSLGIKLGFSPDKCKARLAKDKRFLQYVQEARRTEGIGPGSYDVGKVAGGGRVKGNRRSVSETPAVCTFRFYDLKPLMQQYSCLRSECNDKQGQLRKS